MSLREVNKLIIYEQTLNRRAATWTSLDSFSPFHYNTVKLAPDPKG